MSTPMEPEEVNDDQLEIVNGQKAYIVSKKLFHSTLPYFENLFSSNLTESKENKVTLNLNSKSFDLIVNWVSTDFLCLNFGNVIPVYETADYLGADRLKTACELLLRESFILDNLPDLLNHITPTCGLINTEQINFFLAINLPQIVASDVFLSFPVHVIDHLTQLKIIYQSEITMVNMILRWAANNIKSRRCHLDRLFSKIKWQFLSAKQLAEFENNLTLRQLLIPSSVFRCTKNVKDRQRNRVPMTIAIYRLDQVTIAISVRSGDQGWKPFGVFTHDEKLSLSILQGDDHTYDIIFDSGRQGIRINVNTRKYRYHEMIGDATSYYGQKHRYILNSIVIEPQVIELSNGYRHVHQICVKDPTLKMASIIESKGEFIVIKTNPFKLIYTFPCDRTIWLDEDFVDLIHAVDINGVTYILTSDYKLIKINRKTEVSTYYQISDGFNERFYKDIILISFEGRKLGLVDARTKKIFLFDETKEQWTFLEHLIISKPLITVTTILMEKF